MCSVAAEITLSQDSRVTIRITHLSFCEGMEESGSGSHSSILSYRVVEDKVHARRYHFQPHELWTHLNGENKINQAAIPPPM